MGVSKDSASQMLVALVGSLCTNEKQNQAEQMLVAAIALMYTNGLKPDVRSMARMLHWTYDTTYSRIQPAKQLAEQLALRIGEIESPPTATPPPTPKRRSTRRRKALKTKAVANTATQTRPADDSCDAESPPAVVSMEDLEIVPDDIKSSCLGGLPVEICGLDVNLAGLNFNLSNFDSDIGVVDSGPSGSRHDMGGVASDLQPDATDWAR